MRVISFVTALARSLCPPPSPPQVLNPSTQSFEPRRWQDVKVGEILEVHRDEFFPADLLFLGSDNVEGAWGAVAPACS